MAARLDINGLEKTYMQKVPRPKLLGIPNKLHSNKKRALAGISLNLTPGLYGLLGPLAAWKTPPTLNRAQDHLKL